MKLAVAVAKNAIPYLARHGAEPWLRRCALLDPSWGGIGFSVTIADAMCLNGNVANALDLLERNTLLLLSRLRPSARKGAAATLAPAERIPEAQKRECFLEAINAFERNGIRSFLAFGVLLGYVREGGFLAHDRDLDLGIMTGDATSPQVREALERADFAITDFRGPEWPCRVKAVHANGVLLDVVFFHPQDGHLLTYMYCHGHLIIRRRAVFELERASFLDKSVWIPAKPERFLEENYGDWRHKSEYHNCLLTSRLTDFSLPIIRYCAARAFYRCLTLRDYAQAKGCLNVVLSHYPDDRFWSSIPELFERTLKR